MYAKQINGEWQQYTLRQLRQDNPQVSFPAEPTDALFAEYGMYPVQVETQPTIDARYQRLVQGSITDTNGVLTRGWIIENIEPTIEKIKSEAQRRILHILPEWKQRNLTARAAELAIKGVQNWSLEEQTEIAAGQALWDQIKAIRAKSNALEAMNPIPVDYADDKYWT